MPDEEFQERVGTMLRGKWKLERLIAIGGMAGVFEARHKIGRVAAIKLLRSEIAVDKTIRERFEQEAAAVNNVAHHGVVTVLDVDEEDGIPFLVMELLEGETLADRVESGKELKPEQLLDIMDQLLDVLIACHKKGVIHRDIKPENLFLQKNGRLKVLDFGIARVREGVRTMAGTMLGTVAFMPPEQLKGMDIDARADLFAVGATMFAVVAGRRLHVAKDDTELAMKMLSLPSPRLGTVAKNAPEPLCMVVDRALAYLPKRRYPDAQTMRGDVWAARRGEKPPYASACLHAGQDPDVLEEPVESDAKKKASKTRSERPPSSNLPSTDPQMPAFVSAQGGGGLPTTDPQMPAFADQKPPSKKAAASEPPPSSEGDSPDSADAGARNTKGYIDVESLASAKPQKTKLGIMESSLVVKPSRTDAGWQPGGDEAKGEDASEERAQDQAAGDDEDGKDAQPDAKSKSAPPEDGEPAESEPPPDSTPSKSEPPASEPPADSEPPESEPPTSEPSASEPPPDSEPADADGDDGADASTKESEAPPSSMPPDSLPPQGALSDRDAREVAEKEAKNYGGLVILLIVIGMAAYAAWYVGVFTPPKPPTPAPAPATS